MLHRNSCICQLYSRKARAACYLRKCLHRSPRLDHQSRSPHITAQQFQEQAQLSGSLFGDPLQPPPPRSSIREQLKKWQSENAHLTLPKFEQPIDSGENVQTSLTRLNSPDDYRSGDVVDDDENIDVPPVAKGAEEDEAVTSSLYLERGDMVELGGANSDRTPDLAIFTQDFEKQVQFYTMKGKWVHATAKSTHYILRSFVPASMVDKIIPYMPDHEITEEELDQAQSFSLDVPRGVGAPLVEKMVNFWKESETAYREHASTLDGAHRALAHQTDLRFGNLQRIAQRLLGNQRDRSLAEPVLYAVHKALVRSGFAFGIDPRSHRNTGVFQIRPVQQVVAVEKVQTWLREYQEDMARSATRHPGSQLHAGTNIIQNFVKTAKTLVQESRSFRMPTDSGNVGPSKIRLAITREQEASRSSDRGIQFTEDEVFIIRFMEAWSSSGIFKRHPTLKALGPILLHAIGEYGDFELNEGTGFMFLQEIGVLTPFENRIKYDENLLLPSSQHSSQLESLKSISEHQDFDLQDSMRDLRHVRFETVFCIDSASANEIDDGIAVERIPDHPDQHWVHVHVANPSAFIPRKHTIAKIAGHMSGSVYMPERVHSMLPSKLTQNVFSLGIDRPTLIFSSKLDANGAIIGKKISHGIVKRVRSLTPQEVDAALGIEKNEKESRTIITVGGHVPQYRARKSPNLSASEEEDLRLLLALGKKRRLLRNEAGAPNFAMREPDIRVLNRFGKEGLGHQHPKRHLVKFVEGDPVLQAIGKPYSEQSYASSDPVADANLLVSEAMILACEMAADWCRERNVPVIYRGTGRRSERADPEIFYNTALKPLVDSGIALPTHIELRYMKMIGAAGLSITPVRHRVLGVDTYSRVTSPLRRYGDLLAHWQIDAAVREEAVTRKSLINLPYQDVDQSSSYLAFSKTEVDLIIQRLGPRETLIRKSERDSQHFWFAMVIWRAWQFGEAELPETFELVIQNIGGHDETLVSAIVRDWSISARLWFPGSGMLEKPKLGDWWEGKIQKISIYERMIVMQPVRLIRRAVQA
ncbi:MAG: hypothetical protein M1820_007906 [Bogoriella megaspora]|nr:MAG: hypothetical protein M1820_007906 [Bogoriella megaspora]